VIIDTSVLVSIGTQEPGSAELATKIGESRIRLISAASVGEAMLAFRAKLGRDAEGDVRALIRDVGIQIVEFGEPQILWFAHAIHRYGRGQHPAKLNFGDCFTYALAKQRDLPVLFTGNAFSQTDLKLA